MPPHSINMWWERELKKQNIYCFFFTMTHVREDNDISAQTKLSGKININQLPTPQFSN